MKPSGPNSTDNWEEVRHAAGVLLGESIVREIECARSLAEPASMLIAILHKTQARFGFLGREHLDAVAQLLQVPASTVSGVATFYHFFKCVKPAKYTFSVCMGTACYVKGADKLLQKLREELGIDVGETTSDGMFGIEQARCLGACGLAPVVMVNDDILNSVTPDSIPALLDGYVRAAKSEQSI